MNNPVFQETSLAGIKLRNRMIRSATHEGLADDSGLPTPALQDLYGRLAKGGIGLIITGFAGVNRQGMSSYHRMLMIDRDDAIPAWQALVATVHRANTPIVIQLAHCGRETRSKVTGMPTVAPSAIRDAIFREDKPQQLDEAGIQAVIDDFVRAIGRAKEAGFDGAQLHLAHGYLLSAFLSPHSNRRRDRWGGSLENRYRIIGEIFRAARVRYGDYPLLVKLNAYDHRRRGMRLPEASIIAAWLERDGCAGIEVSAGVAEDGLATSRGRVPLDELMTYNHLFAAWPSWLKILARPVLRLALPEYQPQRNYHVQDAAALKLVVKIPVIAVGGIRSLHDMQEIIGHGQADFVALCRPLIIEPELPAKLRERETGLARCIDCNCCMVGIEFESVRCYYGRIKPKAAAIS